MEEAKKGKLEVILGGIKEQIFSALNIVGYLMVVYYFDLVPNLVSINSKVNKSVVYTGLGIFFLSICLYIMTYIRMQVTPRPSQRITVERWYTESPFSVFLIISGHAIAHLMFFVGIWPQYGFFLSAFITIIGILEFNNIFQLSPI